MSALRELEIEYLKLASRMQFQEDSLDYGIVANHIAMLKLVPEMTRRVGIGFRRRNISSRK